MLCRLSVSKLLDCKYIKYHSTFKQGRIMKKYAALATKLEGLKPDRVVCRSSAKDHRYPDKISKKKMMRLSMFNKFVMENVTQMLETWAHGGEITASGVEITQVLMDTGMKTIKVYWCHHNYINEAELNKLFLRAEAYLKKEVSTRMNYFTIPDFFFVKDITAQQNIEVVDILQELEKELQALPEGKTTDEVIDSPVIKQNSLGLDRDKILAKIQKAICKKSLPQLSDAREILSENLNDKELVKLDKNIIRQIIHKRRVLEKRNLKSRIKILQSIQCEEDNNAEIEGETCFPEELNEDLLEDSCSEDKFKNGPTRDPESVKK